jgi:ABC-type antimicrobial peptide transport system permease subunit
MLACRKDTLILAVLGLAIGSTIIWEITAFVQSLLFGLRPHDPVTFVTAAVILMASAVAAGLVPALRASKIDPMVALRHE